MNWRVLVGRVQLGVLIWHAVHSHPVNRWALSGADVQAPWHSVLETIRFLRDARAWRLSAGVGRRHSVAIRKASLMTVSMRQLWALRHQTGAQCSAVEWTKAKVAVCNVVAPAPQLVSASGLKSATWYQLLAKWLKVSTERERPFQRNSEVFGLGAIRAEFLGLEVLAYGCHVLADHSCCLPACMVAWSSVYAYFLVTVVGK